jgi:enamine deaminase RidA (YjgF/YER057c/UK114 family)
VNPYTWLGSEIESQTDFTLRRLSEIADAAGTSLDRCVKADVTICHPSDYVGFERVWRRWFPDRAPARTVVTGARLVLKGIRVEIAMVLLAGDSPHSPERVCADVPDPPGHAPHAVRAGEFVFLSGLLPGGPDGAIRPELLRAPARAQAHDLLVRIDAICAASGTSLENVCKVLAFHRDLEGLPALLEEWQSAFSVDPPVLSAMGMGGPDPLLVPGAEIVLDVIAWAPPMRANKPSKGAT